MSDDEAYLGVEATPINASNGTTDLHVTVTNRFPPGTELTTVAVTVDGNTVDLAASDPFAPGESASHTFSSVPCGARIGIAADSADVRVTLDRSVPCS